MSIKKFEIIEMIAKGGMAEVYRARTTGLQGFEKEVCVKKILPHLTEDETFVSMFIDEAKLAATLSFANIVQVHDLCVSSEGEYFIVMEYVDGKDLSDIIRAAQLMGREVPPDLAVHIAREVCQGLAYAHTRTDKNGTPLNIIHRDVSPHNVLVSFMGEVKLVDFGIAKASSSMTKTAVGVLKGKYGYMSPEQARGQPLDGRSDIFNTGIVLYEMLVGERCFAGASDFSTLNLMRNAEIVPPIEINPQVPPSLQAVVLHAMAKSADDRPQTALDLERELGAWARDNNAVATKSDLARFLQELFVDPLPEEHRPGTDVLEIRSVVARPAEPLPGKASGGPGLPPPADGARRPPPLPEPSSPEVARKPRAAPPPHPPPKDSEAARADAPRVEADPSQRKAEGAGHAPPPKEAEATTEESERRKPASRGPKAAPPPSREKAQAENVPAKETARASGGAPQGNGPSQKDLAPTPGHQARPQDDRGPAPQDKDPSQRDLSPATHDQDPSKKDLAPAPHGQDLSTRDLTPAAQGQDPSKKDLTPAAQGQDPSKKDLTPAPQGKAASPNPKASRDKAPKKKAEAAATPKRPVGRAQLKPGSVPSRRRPRRTALTVAAVALLAGAGGALVGAWRRGAASAESVLREMDLAGRSAPAPELGLLLIESSPPGLNIEVGDTPEPFPTPHAVVVETRTPEVRLLDDGLTVAEKSAKLSRRHPVGVVEHGDPPVPKAKPEFAVLQVVAPWGARVEIDGARPPSLEAVELSPGTHTVSVRQRRDRRTFKVLLEPGQTQTLVVQSIP